MAQLLESHISLTHQNKRKFMLATVVKENMFPYQLQIKIIQNGTMRQNYKTGKYNLLLFDSMLRLISLTIPSL